MFENEILDFKLISKIGI